MLRKVLQGVIEDDGFEDGLLLAVAEAVWVPGKPREAPPPMPTPMETRTCATMWFRAPPPRGMPPESRTLGDAV